MIKSLAPSHSALNWNHPGERSPFDQGMPQVQVSDLYTFAQQSAEFIYNDSSPSL